MAPAKQRAALVTENGVAFGLADVPKPGPGQILVKVATAAQNPLDCQSLRPCFDACSLRTHLASIYIYQI
jgi:NADPH:quinone reductase-like Zn-dependent oxidoreductase